VSSTDDAPVLEDMTKTELQEHADELGVEYNTTDSKQDLVDKIIAGADPPPVADDEEQTGDEEDGDAEVVEGDQSGAAISSFPGAVPSEQFPERRPMEVDLSDVEDPEAEYEGEFQPPLNAESWVVLDGSHDSVPDELDGAIAAVVSAPSITTTNPDTGETQTSQPPEGLVGVRERSQGILIYLPMEAFKKVYTNGRPEVLGFA
jgi:hypothetical protein